MEGGDQLSDYMMLKVTPKAIRNKLLNKFPDVILVENPSFLKYPSEYDLEIRIYNRWIRELKRLEDSHQRYVGGVALPLYDLTFYRGEFDSAVNAYKVTSKIPRVLFERARKEGWVFPVRFKSVLLEENPEGVLFWYINESVSL